jgi:pilus assembly protein CpaB
MMNGRLITVLVFALAVASAASFAVYHFLASGIKQQPTVVIQSKLLVASRDLEVGALLKEADLREMPWSGELPAHALNSTGEIVGRGVVATIYKDEPIFAARLAGKGAGAGLAATIPIGKRAVALRINDVVGLAGFVQPGMRVDVLIAGSGPGTASGQSGVLARTVLQNIEVLSAGQKFERNLEGKPEEAQVVNLLVSPDQAEVLSLAGSETKVQLVLRNPLDTEEQPTKGTSISRLFGVTGGPDLLLHGVRDEPIRPHIVSSRVGRPLAAVPEPVVVPKPESSTVEVFTGAKRSEQQVAPPAEARDK